MKPYSKREITALFTASFLVTAATIADAQTSPAPIAPPPPLAGGTIQVLQGPTLSNVLQAAPSGPQPTANPQTDLARPELAIPALPPLAQLYWISSSSDEAMRRLRSEAASDYEEWIYYTTRIYQDALTAQAPRYLEGNGHMQDNAEMDSVYAGEYQRKYYVVLAEIASRRTELAMKPLPVPDETHIVQHTGNYSVIQSGTSQTVSYVNRNVADEPVKTSGSHTEVTYHIVDVMVPMGFAADGTPITRKGMDVVRVEKEVPDN